MDFISATSPEKLLWIIGLTLLLELVTCVLRFVAGLRAARDTGWLARYTLGFRIHHGYVGLLAIAVGACLIEQGRWRDLLLIAGCSLLLSDLIHHFVVLWITEGAPQFDLRYPNGRASSDRVDPGD